MSVKNTFTAAALGAGAMYMLDPERGRRRQARVRDQITHFKNRSEQAAETVSADVRNRTRGILARTRHRNGHDSPDSVIVERVRSKLGRYCSHPHAVQVTASDGHVTLEGDILAREVEGAVHAARAARGVHGVQNNLQVHDSAENVPTLQGGRERPGEIPAILQENPAPAVCLMMLLGGAAIFLRGFSRKGLGGMLETALGFGLMGRGLGGIK